LTKASSVSHSISPAQGRRIWLHAQRLDVAAPFGNGPEATRLAVEHLGYVQIDTIHVIERSHHHILFTRIPEYRRAHLTAAQSIQKSIFEYWTHALSYVPTRDIRFFIGAMKGYRRTPMKWYQSVTSQDTRKVIRLLKKNGSLTIRDIDDDVLIDKEHLWASRKPSKHALQLLFYSGFVTVCARMGMLKTYTLMEPHFGWKKLPKAASEREIVEYGLDRALRAQGIVSLDSVCYMDAKRKLAVRRLIESRVRRQELVPVVLKGAEKIQHWTHPELLDPPSEPTEPTVHLLSPFDPLIIQRKRLQLFFDYEHRFEAYLPKEKRVFGYFALPVLVDDAIVAAIDLKTDRENRKLLIQKWTWVGRGSARAHKRRIEEALHRFERFQLE
jgi:uncharacterized protein YcaQ